jgi:hypothetical protein
LTMHLGPSNILVAVTIDFAEGLPGAGVQAAARHLTDAIGAEVPGTTYVFLRPRRSDNADARG